MFQKLTYTILFFSLCVSTSFGQETWTIEKCIQYAQQNSLTIKQAENSIEQSRLSIEENKNARLPTLNANIQGGINFGRTIDRSTNLFVTKATGFNQISINAGYTLYNGNRRKNSITQSEINAKAADSNARQISTDLALQVAAAYLQILLDEEALANANKRIEQTQSQLSQTDKLIQAGTRPQSDRLEILAQIARDEQSIVNQQNSVEISYLNLKQLLELKPDHNLKVDRPTAIIPNNINPETYALEMVYNKALGNQPMIKTDELNIQSAELDVEIAKGLRLPTISLWGNISSNYSSTAETFVEGTKQLSPAQDVVIDGIPAAFQSEFTPVLSEGKTSYFTQIGDNFGQGFGVTISVPIYNQNQTKIAMERANLNILNNRITSQQNKQRLKTDIQRAIANAKANKKQFEASEKTVTALADAYSNTEKRYKLGAVNTFEYTTAKNSLDQAEVDLIIAKYNYLYSLKVVDFYQGTKITLR